MDLIGSYAEMHAGHEVYGSRSRLYQEFFRREWSSEDRNGAPPQRRERTFHDTSLKVGVLDKDHPEPNTTRRHINWPEDDDLPVLAPFVTETSSIPRSLRTERLAGAFIDPHYVRLDPDLDRDQARNRVIEHYDHREKIRISAWNHPISVSVVP
ncbi:hypothetical protein CEP53_010027 [Fusarium sp. AF-6]|nr:hypothetical protein CEP53_010027 [Fusarium sp. AF-6]